MNDKTFGDRYKKRFNAEVQIYSPYSYDAVGVLVDAMKRAKSVDPAKYIAELPKTSYPGLTGKIEFDDKGDRKDAEMTIFTMKGGKIDDHSVVSHEASDVIRARDYPDLSDEEIEALFDDEFEDVTKLFFDIVIINIHNYVDSEKRFLGVVICKAYDLIHKEPLQCIEMQNLRNYLINWLDILMSVVPRETIIKNLGRK